jgi:NAD(P)-dependent dehydrogenase (short-subunit alcohol dehydrogenase family)
VEGKNMATPILVTGAAGRVGGIGRTITGLLLKQGKAVRAMVRNEDKRAQALRDLGAEVVVGDLLDLDSMHRVIAARLASPPPHLGTIGHPTGPQSENRHCDAQEYAKAHGRMITCQDMPAEPWRDGLLERGSPVHPVNHLATMAELRRAERYDRMSDDVRTLTGQGPLRAQEILRKHAATCTAPAQEA